MQDLAGLNVFDLLDENTYLITSDLAMKAFAPTLQRSQKRLVCQARDILAYKCDDTTSQRPVSNSNIRPHPAVENSGKFYYRSPFGTPATDT